MIRARQAWSLLAAAAVAFTFSSGAAAQAGSANSERGCRSADLAPGPDCPSMMFAASDDAPPAPSPQGMRAGRRQLEQFRTLKLLELLDLKPDQETKFLVAFKSMRDRHTAVMQQRDSLLDQLADGLKDSTLHGQQIYDLTTRLQQVKQEHMQETQKFLDTVRGILTPEQYGRMIVFQERFEFQLLDSIRSFREHHGRGRTRGTDRDPGPPDPDGY